MGKQAIGGSLSHMCSQVHMHPHRHSCIWIHQHTDIYLYTRAHSHTKNIQLHIYFKKVNIPTI